MSQKLRIAVQGMTCASCVGHVEHALSDVAGVSDVSVNLATEQASMTIENAGVAVPVAATLEKTGYPADLEKINLVVEGMTCASCVGRVERILLEQPGVLSATVNLATQMAQVTALGASTNAASLAAAVTAAGYLTHPEKQIAEAEKNDRKEREIKDLRRLTMTAGLLTLPVFALEMGSHFIPGVHELIGRTIGHEASWIIQFVLTTLVLAGPGRVFFAKGVPALLRATPEMNSLVAMGASAAWIYSTLALFVPSIFPEGTRAVYFEAAAVIATLILLGRYLEARAKGRTGAAIKRLVGLQPTMAHVQRGDETVEIAIAEIVTGDVLHVRPGERIAVDGIVTGGNSYVDESMITGEPVPVLKLEGATVVAGTLNGTGALVFSATAVGAQTMLAQIIRMVEDAQGAKLPIQTLVDRITGVFVPVVMAVAALTVAVWLIFGPDPALSLALVAGVSVLIIACPCAMGLATPTSIMVGTGRAAELGVLFRKGDALQGLQDARIIALDKTGTLTAGKPEMTTLQVVDGWDAGDALALLASVETLSEHPIADAIVRAAKTRGLGLLPVDTFETVTGMGATATVNGQVVLIGADRYLTANGISLDVLGDAGKSIAANGETPLYGAVDGRVIAAIGVSDPIKPGTPAAIEALHKLGLKVAMITGDNQATATLVAAHLDIDHVVAEVLPAGKVAALKQLRDSHGSIAFVGDGVNDAPALAQADTGIAIGSGTDVAIEAADVVLMSGDLAGVVNALKISGATMRNIRQNLFWAFAYNAALIPIAAGVLYPLNGTLLSPMLAASAMALSSVFVLSNALRLRRVAPALVDLTPRDHSSKSIPGPAHAPAE